MEKLAKSKLLLQIEWTGRSIASYVGGFYCVKNFVARDDIKS